MEGGKEGGRDGGREGTRHTCVDVRTMWTRAQNTEPPPYRLARLTAPKNTMSHTEL